MITKINKTNWTKWLKAGVLSFLLPLSSFLAVSCSPEEFDGPNQAGIPSVSGIDFDMNIDQSVNQATFTVPNLPAQTYAVWSVNGASYSTLNPMNWANNKAGTYDVELRLGNRNGFSQGSISKTFKFDNSKIDLEPYVSRIARTWRINYAEAGHMGCGDVGSDGSGWWTAAPDEKADWGVYDDRLTFTEDGSYTYDPGDEGTVYVNYGASIFPEYNIAAAEKKDFIAPVDEQTASYEFAIEGDDVVLRLPAKTLFPYISSDNQYNNPVFTVVKLTNSEMVLLYKDASITWRFMFTSKEDAGAPFNGFKANSDFNMWKKATFTNDFYYAHGDSWEGNPQPIGFETISDNKYKVSLPCESNQQWQAQVKFFTDMSSSAANNYDFSAIFTTTNDIKGATVKLVLHGGGENDNIFYFADRIDLDAGDSYVFWKSDMSGIDMDKVDLVLDFGGAPAGTEVEIKNVVFKNHADDDGTVLPSDQPGPDTPEQPAVNWVAVDSPDNLGAGFNTAGKMNFWWADGSWNQVGDPGFSFANGIYTITAVENGGSEWQGQCSITGVPLHIEEGQAYDVRVKIVASDDLGRVTLKVNKDPDETNDPNTLCYKGDFKLEAGENYLEMTDVVAKNGSDLISFEQGKLIFDFGGAPAGFEAKISDIIIQKHGTAPEEGGSDSGELSYDDASNLWKAVDDGSVGSELNYYFAAGDDWHGIDFTPATHTGDTYEIILPDDLGKNQWQGQFHIDTKLTASATKKYDFQLVMEVDQDCPGVTIKLTDAGDTNYFCEGRHDIPADEPYIFTLKGTTLNEGTDATAIRLFFDFGGSPGGTTVKISKIIFKEA